MREIKFRGWYIGTYKNRMLEPNFNGPVNKIFNDPDNEGKVIYMQYTGLKDKNGKEIYEGDILEDKWGYRFPVFFEDGCYKTDSEDFEKVNERQINYHNLKVNGNIYENPELLEESQNGTK